MRIVSELVPGGQPISTDIEGARQMGKADWEIPSWGRPLALGVYPFFVVRDLRLVPAGTAFCISKLGVSVTSARNLREAARHRPDTVRTSEESRVEMAVFHHRALSRGRFSGKIWRFGTAEEVPLTDVCYVFPQFQGEFPYLPLPVSFQPPRIGSRIICVGFCGSTPVESLSLSDAQTGRLDLLEKYEHRLHAVEARVTRIFRRRFSPGFVEGPCYSIDAELEHDMHGGPAFSENGYVCGIVSGKATGHLGGPASIVSLLYPALSAKVRFDGRMGAMRISSNLRLSDLIAQSSVVTDGSEHLLMAGQESTFSTPHSIPIEDSDGVYEDLAHFQEERQGRRRSGP